MNFFTFLLYFIVSHLIYSVVVGLINTGILYYRHRKEKKRLEEMFKGATIVSLESSDEGDGQWH